MRTGTQCPFFSDATPRADICEMRNYNCEYERNNGKTLQWECAQDNCAFNNMAERR